MNMCYEVACRSPDASTHSGAFITKQDNTPVSFGYNGVPRKVKLTPERQKRPEKYFFFEHAERNALYNAGRNGVPLIDCKLYINWVPCSDCARGIIQSGITEVVIHKQGMDAFLLSRNESVWSDHYKPVFEMFKESNVKVRWYDGHIRVGLTGLWSGKRYAFLGNPKQRPVEIKSDSEILWRMAD